MHYIVGTTIIIPESVNIQKTGPVAVDDLAANRVKRVKNVTPFQTNVPYAIATIRNSPEKDGIVYTFESQVGEVLLKFNSTRDADNYIAGLRGEQIPDYDAMRRD